VGSNLLWWCPGAVKRVGAWRPSNCRVETSRWYRGSYFCRPLLWP
jgi:hypothetical protein